MLRKKKKKNKTKTKKLVVLLDIRRGERGGGGIKGT